MAGDRALVVAGGQVLEPGADEPTPGTLVCRNGQIEAVGGPELAGELDPADADTIDASGRLVVPGIIDLHGDAFERCLMPRPGVSVPIDLALDDNDAQLLAAGITTSYLSATDSWEPGLRSRATLLALAEALDRRGDGPDVRLHVRHERCNTDDHEELVDLVDTGRVAMLSYNDHTGDPDRGDGRTPSMTQQQRTGLGVDELIELERANAATRATGAKQERVLAEVARRRACPTASHDSATDDDLARDLDLGVGIAEFPTSIELARRYRDEGILVLLGAPNLVRGGSHLGNLSVADALAAGTGDILCSDYHYPSLLQAPFVAAAEGIVALGAAWRQVSEHPARAAGLPDRGRLEVGARADVLVVTPGDGRMQPATVDHVLVAGRAATLRP